MRGWNIKYWRMATRKKTHAQNTPTTPWNLFSSSGRSLLACENINTIRVWTHGRTIVHEAVDRYAITTFWVFQICNILIIHCRAKFSLLMFWARIWSWRGNIDQTLPWDYSRPHWGQGPVYWASTVMIFMFSSFICFNHFQHIFQHIYSITIAMCPATIHRFPF